MGLMNRRLAAWFVALLALAGLAGCQGLTDQRAAATPAAAPQSPGPTPQAARPTIRPTATARPASPTATPMPPTATPVPVSPTPAATPAPAPQPAEQRWDYPIGWAGRIPGDGFYIRHGYAAENTWYNPGHWHTGEDWYALGDAETAGAEVYAAAAGTVAYAGGNYPGRVVIIDHGDLFSMYGHLDPALLVAEGQAVERGAPLGLVLRRGDAVPNHLHFEVRGFLTAAAVNGASPRHPFRCGPGCPPGPGYWPIADPEPPALMGWRNPTHAIAGRGFARLGPGIAAAAVVASAPPSASAPLWSAPPGDGAPREQIGEVALEPGARLALLAIAAPAEDDPATSSAAYGVWYQVALPDGRSGWLQAATPSSRETGADGRPSSVTFTLFPSARTRP